MREYPYVATGVRTGVARFAAVCAATGLLTAVMASPAGAAAGGYGPTPPSNGAPGGFTTVVTSQLVGPGGGSVSATVNGKAVSITVPPGAFRSTEDVVVTAPDLGAVQNALSTLGFSGFNAVAGVGVAILDTNGNKATGSFPVPIQVTISGSGLGASGEKVLSLTGPASATTLSASMGSNAVTIAITSDPNLVVINPTTGSGTGGRAVPGATTAFTGKPFTGERDLALALAALGIAAVGVGAVRRVRLRWRGRL